jgi:hypothetical protein
VGDSVTIHGANLSGATVTFNGSNGVTTAFIASDTPTQIETSVPFTATTGTVVVTTSTGTASAPFRVLVPSPTQYFVKTKKTSSHTVEVFWDVLKEGSYKRAADLTSDFNPTAASEGRFQLFGGANGAAPQLGYIKTKNPGTGKVEVFWDNFNGSCCYKRAADLTSDFSPTAANEGVFQLFGSANGAPQLGFIKTKSPGTGKVEVHWDNFNGSCCYKRAADLTSDFNTTAASEGVFQLFGSANGAPELGYIKTKNAGTGTVEMHWDVFSGSSYTRVGDFASDFSLTASGLGFWQAGPFL